MRFTIDCNGGQYGTPFIGSGATKTINLCYGEIDGKNTVGKNLVALLNMDASATRDPSDGWVYRFSFAPKTGEIEVAARMEDADDITAFMPGALDVAYADSTPSYFVYSTFKYRDGILGIIPSVAPTASQAVVLASTGVISTGNGVLGKPTLISPSDTATGVRLTSSLSWSSVAGATQYQVYVGTASGSWNVVNGVTTTSPSYTPNLLLDTKYFWRVIACNSNGCSDPSATQSFSTVSVILPPDSTPNQFAFTDIIGATPNTVYSGTITVSGMDSDQSTGATISA